MKRSEMLARLEDRQEKWDIIIIGGGATGIGAAIDAASRGYDALLLEQSDFGKGTSSRSTKLIHGGVRYLQQGNISFVLEALEERGLLMKNAPHLVHNLPFVVPNYDWWEGPFYGIGLKLYNMLAWKSGFSPSKILSKEKTIELIPTVETEGLRGGVIYYDGQFDDARLLINMAQTAAEQGGTLLNYFKVTDITKHSDQVSGVIAVDMEREKEYEIQTKVLINATGVFTDSIRKMDDPDSQDLMRPSQGSHIVLDKSFLPGESAIMVPHTDDGRVLFTIPWHDKVVVGSTDIAIDNVTLEPIPLMEEVDFLITQASRYLVKDPTPNDILSAFAGLRPLIGSQDIENTAALSRDHSLCISRSGLVTITGGKWTTYRKMAEETINQAAIIAQLDSKECVTRGLRVHGFHKNSERFEDLSIYGADAPMVQNLLRQKPSYLERISLKSPIRKGEVVWSVRNEMARTVEDYLSRRTRFLIIDPDTSLEAAPVVAKLMAKELGKKKRWIKEQIKAYTELVSGYMVS